MAVSFSYQQYLHHRDNMLLLQISDFIYFQFLYLSNDMIDNIEMVGLGSHTHFNYYQKISQNVRKKLLIASVSGGSLGGRQSMYL